MPVELVSNDIGIIDALLQVASLFLELKPRVKLPVQLVDREVLRIIMALAANLPRNVLGLRLGAKDAATAQRVGGCRELVRLAVQCVGLIS